MKRKQWHVVFEVEKIRSLPNCWDSAEVKIN